MCTPENKSYRLSGFGTVVSHTTIYDAPAGFEKFVPYTVALVKLIEGPTITSQLTDLEMEEKEEIINGEVRVVQQLKVDIGMPVEMVTRILKFNGDEGRGLIIYGHKFRPRGQVGNYTPNP